MNNAKCIVIIKQHKLQSGEHVHSLTIKWSIILLKLKLLLETDLNLSKRKIPNLFVMSFLV